MFKRIVIFLMVSSFVSIASMAFAEETQKMHHMKMFKERADKIKSRLEELTKELNLTPEQQAKIKEILTKSKEEIKKIFEDTKVKVKGLRVKAHNEISAFLTPEQKAKFKDIRKKQEAPPKIEE